QPGKPTILYFHGNAGSLVTRGERVRKYQERGYGMFMMTYRGFGGSTGQASERANVADAKQAYDLLISNGVKATDIVLYGESLGSGIATQVAAAKQVAGLILDAPYTTMVEVAELHYPYLPARWFMTDRYQSTKYIARINAPLLIIHGEDDVVIPVSMGRALYQAAQEPKEIAIFRGAGHADHHAFGSYQKIWQWLQALPAAAKRASAVRAAE
nr:alpha/beta hydrolase [Alphaproteobacteria bacterium]